MRFFKPTYCYVYMVRCANGDFYTGMTWNLHRRLRQHNGEAWGGARYTELHRPVVLVHLERFDTREEAHNRELEIKSWTHTQKQDLIDRTSKNQILEAI